MSLRGRLIGLVGLVLLVSLAIYIVIAWDDARRDLAAEIEAARRSGLQTVSSAFEDLPRSDHRSRDLRQLIATFDGNRHLSAALLDRSGRVRVTSAVAVPGAAAPRWFTASLSPAGEPSSLPVPGEAGALLRLRPEPASDIAAQWSIASTAVALFAVAAVVALALIHWVIGRALAPLADLSRGLGTIGAPGHRERVLEQGPPELLALQRGFNEMSGRLADTDERNRALEAQLLTIQDEERAEIARDLHDEIGPHLFAVALEAETIGRSLGSGETRFIPEQVRSIQTAVSYMQRQVRELIARLRPTRAAELGLEAALRDLVALWEARQPEVAFETELDGADEFVPERMRDAIYRVVQEAVANALRHAETTRLTVALVQTDRQVELTVSNEGTAKDTAKAAPGLGLVSMRERVHGAGGVLRIQRASRGWTIMAQLPLACEKLAA